MSIEEFYNRYEGKYSLKLINMWLKKGYIRGAKEINNLWYIPNNALPPYTKHGNPKGVAIYKNIVKGVNLGYDVFGKIYNISDSQFDVYINELSKRHFLTVKELDGIKYYFPTPDGEKFVNMTKSKILKIFSEIGKVMISSVIESTIKNV